MKKWLLSSWIFFAYGFVFGQAPKDTLFFSNGSMVIGEMKGVKLGVVNFDPDDANDITVQLNKLKSIAAVSKVFRIETISHQVFFGKMVPCDQKSHVQVLADGDSIILHLEDISVLYPFKDRFKQRFSGNVSAGFNFTRSGNLGQLNFNSKLSYIDKKEEITLSANGVYSITDTAVSRDREDVGLKYNHYFSTTWFGTLLLNYQRNIELGLDRRFQEGFGAGNKFITSKHVYAWSRVGMVVNQEKSTENVNSGTLAELYAQMEFNFFRFSNPKISLFVTQSFYYSLSQAGRFRNDGQTDLSWEIVTDLNLNLTFYNNYDNQPPTEGSRKFDFSVVIGVTLKF